MTLQNASNERVLVVARSIAYPGDRTGAETRLAGLVREFRACGATVAVLAAPPAALPSDETAARRRVRKLLPQRMLGLRRDLAALLGAAAWARRVLKEVRAFQPTVIVERAAYLDPSGALLARRLGLPHILELHGVLADDARSYYRSPLEPVGAWYERRRYRRAEAVVAVSEGLGRFAAEVGARRWAVIPNGVDVPTVLTPRAAAIAKLREHRNLEGRRIVGWIGHLMEWQASSFADLCTALSLVADDLPVALIVVGEPGELARDALGGAEFPVHLMGSVSRATSNEVVRGFEAGFVPGGLDYALPVKLFQYGALEVPVVAPRLGSLIAFADGHEFFFDYDDGDPVSLAEAIRSALESAADDSRVRALRDEVASRHTWAAVANELLAVIAEVSGK